MGKSSTRPSHRCANEDTQPCWRHASVPISHWDACVSQMSRSSGSATGLTAMELLYVLAHPGSFHIRPAVWHALNPPAELVESHPDHTLPARLGMGAGAFWALWQQCVAAPQANALKKMLDETRAAAGTTGGLVVERDVSYYGDTRVRSHRHALTELPQLAVHTDTARDSQLGALDLADLAYYS